MDCELKDYFTLLKYFNTYKLNRYNQLMDYACKTGNLDLVKFLYDKGYIGTTNSIDWASELGYFDIVIFLFGIGYSCTTNAIDGAAYNGHLHIIKFLTLTGNKFSYNALYGSIINKHFDILKYICTYIDFDAKSVELAHKINDKQILDYVENKFNEN